MKFSLTQKNIYLKFIHKQPPLVKVICYALMPNHYHFLLKTTSRSDMSKFISTIQNSYAKYYNLIHDRDGGLFQSEYKSRIINSNEDFFGISKYIHLNPVNSNLILINKLPFTTLTSLYYYKHSKENYFVNTESILNQFGGFQGYWNYLSTSPGG